MLNYGQLGYAETGKFRWMIPGALIMLVVYLLLGGTAFALLWTNKAMLYIVIAILALWFFRRVL